ncbi:hypothetical protein GCM10023208_34750 [Erythrobacter westpacificensis]|uniref:Secreted protein n=1 Tax=Erythrobacter westpacificensis TaxID=1055231 RepID=A0ABP9KTX4_9SPHN
MKMALTACLGACLTFALASPSFADGIVPPNYSFSIYGPGNLVKNGGQESWACAWNFKMVSGPATGTNPPNASSGSVTGGSAPAPSACSDITISPTTWEIISVDGDGGEGRFIGLRIKEGLSTFCWTNGWVPFTIENHGDAPTVFTLTGADIGPDCKFSASLNTAADLNVVE